MQNPSGVTPVDMRVLVKPDKIEQKTAGGVWKPETALDKEKYAGTKAVLIARGDNAFREWGAEASKPEPGSRVHFAQYSGSWIKGEDGEDYVIMNDADLTSILGATQ